MKKRILFIITKGEIGGAQRFVLEQIKTQSDFFDCFLLTNKHDWLSEALTNIIDSKNIFFDSRIERIYRLDFVMEICKTISENKIDLVICNSANGGFFGRLAALFCQVKSIYVSHGWSSIYNGSKYLNYFNLIERLFSYAGTSILCVSKEDSIKATQIIKIRPSKINVIINSILPLANLKESRNKGGNRIKVLSVSRLTHPKRLDLLIEAISGMIEFELHIIGVGDKLESLINLTKKINSSNVFFHGRVENFSDFGNYDIFALISESEGLPISALEAMSCGTALLLSDVGGCKELIDENGYLVQNSIESIKINLSNLLVDLEMFKLRSLENFRENFNLQNNKLIYKNYYDKIINN